ncbi:hypothetical protein IKF89_00750 [Candidatus Saccharibacteria bacterium]|nr:hypothetical protein [Candidatus Saccharibacteria bacterium]
MMKKIAFSLLLIFIGTIIISAPVFAECPEGSVPTAILGGDGMIVGGTNGERCLVGTDNGATISHIFKTIIEIMTIGVGLLAILGITIVGIQYLTAGGNEEQTRKAKRRMTEIVIGLVAFVGFGSALFFLIPDAPTDPGNVEYQGGQTRTSNSTSTTTSTSSGTKNKTTPASNELTAEAEKAKRVKKLKETVKAFAWPKTYDPRQKGATKTCWGGDGNARTTVYTKARGDYAKYAHSSRCGDRDCGVFVVATIRHSGWDTNYKKCQTDCQYKYLKNSSDWQEITNKVKTLGNKYLEPGDVIVTKVRGHVMLFADVDGFSHKVVEASFGHYTAMAAKSGHRNIQNLLNNDSRYTVFRRTKW